VVTVDLAQARAGDPPRHAVVEVLSVHRHVPEMIRFRVAARPHPLGRPEGGQDR
jgi:hypothetical protein